MRIDWQAPPPRQGWSGQWDRFVGPGASSAEEWVQLGLGSLIAVASLMIYWWSGGFDHVWWASAVIAFLALDIGGGIVTNATNAAKRWYHRPEHGRRRAHLMFIAVHGLHIGAVAFLFAANPVLYFGLVYGFVLIAALIISLVPLYLQRPVAFALVALGVVGAQWPPLVPQGLGWFIPLLLLKLLLGHLLKEAPFAPEHEGAAQ